MRILKEVFITVVVAIAVSNGLSDTRAAVGALSSRETSPFGLSSMSEEQQMKTPHKANRTHVETSRETPSTGFMSATNNSHQKHHSSQAIVMSISNSHNSAELSDPKLTSTVTSDRMVEGGQTGGGAEGTSTMAISSSFVTTVTTYETVWKTFNVTTTTFFNNTRVASKKSTHRWSTKATHYTSHRRPTYAHHITSNTISSTEPTQKHTASASSLQCFEAGQPPSDCAVVQPNFGSSVRRESTIARTGGLLVTLSYILFVLN